jgi:hypothetical protein
MKTKKIKLTKAFSERTLKHYGRRIVRGEMPCEILKDMTAGGRFTPLTERKVRSVLSHSSLGGIGREGLMMFKDGQMTDREMHDAMKRAAKYWSLENPPEPKWPAEPEAPKPPPPPEGGKGESDPKGEKDESGESKPGEGKGEPEKKEDEGGSDGAKGESEGKGSSGSSEDGDGKGEGEGESDSRVGKGSDGEGEAAEVERNFGTHSGETKGGTNPNRSFGPGAGAAPIGGTSLGLHEQLSHLRDRCEAAQPPPVEATQLPLWSSLKAPEYLARDRAYAKVEDASLNQLLAKVREQLMAVSRHRITRDRESGDVDFTKVSDLAGGVNLDRVYRTVSHAKRLNSAVQILLDGSGSMASGSSRDTISGQFGWALAKVCENLRVPVQVLAVMGACHLLKDWHEKVSDSKVADRIRSYSGDGGNHLPAAMEQALAILRKRRESRLIQLITTDGDIGWTTTATRAKMEAQYKELVASGKGLDEAFERAYSCQRTIWLRGYRGDANDVVTSLRDRWWKVPATTPEGKPYTCSTCPADLLESRLAAYYKSEPRLKTFAFGIQIDVPPGIFHRSFNNLSGPTMVDRIVETLATVLVAEAS